MNIPVLKILHPEKCHRVSADRLDDGLVAVLSNERCGSWQVVNLDLNHLTVDCRMACRVLCARITLARNTHLLFAHFKSLLARRVCVLSCCVRIRQPVAVAVTKE